MPLSYCIWTRHIQTKNQLHQKHLNRPQTLIPPKSPKCLRMKQRNLKTPWPEPGTESCVQWQDCGPHFGDQNSLYECVNNTALDPSGVSEANCANAGGYFIAQECFCALTDVAPPSEPIEYDDSEYEECWYHWQDVPCDPDEWVDTSYYTEECYYDSNNELICNTVYVNDGYWREGHCPTGWWEVWCY